MSDDIFDSDDDVVGGEEAGPGGQKKVGFLGGMLIQILKWVAIGLGAIVFIVTVVVITVNIITGNQASQTALTTSDGYEGTWEELGWYSAIGEIRGRTADENPATFIVEVQLGYDEENRTLYNTIVAQTPRITHFIRQYFANKTLGELPPNVPEGQLLDEIKQQLNRLLSGGQIQEVIFTSFNVLPL